VKYEHRGSIIASLRIKNQYLLSILSLVAGLGTKNVSSALLVETWKSKGRPCDDNFFMHFDVLHTYRFLEPSGEPEKLMNIDQLLQFTTEQDRLVSITHEGQEFLDRFGGR